MNTEQALIQLLLKNPKEIIEISSHGFKKQFIQNKSLKKTFDLILDRYSRFQSVPTEEELEQVKFEFLNEDVPYSLKHCTDSIYRTYATKMMQEISLRGADILAQQGYEAQQEFLTQSIAMLPKMDTESNFKELSQTKDKFLETYETRSKNKNKIIGLETGFSQLDLHTRGLMPQWFVVIQGRNGQFKSWVLANWAKTMFLNKKNIAIFSCEMSYEEMQTRIHSLAIGIPENKIKYGELDEYEQEKMKTYLSEISDTEKYGKLYIHDNPRSLDLIRLDIQSILQKHPIDVIFLDSIYRLSGRADTEGYTKIARGCKDLAKDFNVPVIATIQSNREFAKENKKFKREIASNGMSSFGSDAWNQDSDMMLILHRYDEMKPFNYSQFAMDKFRHGAPLNSILEINLKVPIIQEVNWDEAVARIENDNPQIKAENDEIFNAVNQELDIKHLLTEKLSVLGGKNELN